MCTLKEFMDAGKVKFGALDFGYTNDPTAAAWIKADSKRKIIWVHELCYDPGISMPNVRKLFKGCGFTSETPVYCDHDFEAVRQLRINKINAEMMRKGPNSIKAGIDFLNKEWTVFYTDTSEHIDYEKKRYKWEVDPLTGKPTNIPVDQFNHFMDAIRAAVYTRYMRQE